MHGESSPLRTEEHSVPAASFLQESMTPNCVWTASSHAERSQLQVLGHWMPEAPEGPKTFPSRHLPYAPHQPQRPVPVHCMHGEIGAGVGLNVAMGAGVVLALLAFVPPAPPAGSVLDPSASTLTARSQVALPAREKGSMPEGDHTVQLGVMQESMPSSTAMPASKAEQEDVLFLHMERGVGLTGKAWPSLGLQVSTGARTSSFTAARWAEMV